MKYYESGLYPELVPTTRIQKITNIDSDVCQAKILEVLLCTLSISPFPVSYPPLSFRRTEDTRKVVTVTPRVGWERRGIVKPG